MGVIDLKAERRKRRPVSREDQLMAAAEVLYYLRKDAAKTLFVDSALVLAAIGPVAATLIQAAADLTDTRRAGVTR